MIELAKYFRILFMSVRISRERLKDFTESHILRLTANNPGGIFTTILTAVTAAYNNYYGDLSSESVNLAVQEGKTIAMNASRVALEKILSDNENLVAYTYRNTPETYEEFYPLGMSEYYQSDLPTFETITDRYKTVLAAHAGDFTAGFVTDYNTAQALFKANREAQTTAKANVSAERSDLVTTREELAYYLTKNVLTIALEYTGEEAKAEVYFDQSILNAAFKESATKVDANIDPGLTQNVFDNVTKPEVEIKGNNNGEEALYIGYKASEDEACTAADKVLAPGEVGYATSGELGWSTTKKYLNVTNPGANAGSYIIEKV